MRLIAILVAAAAVFALAAPSSAQTVEAVKPACGAPGDLVLILGEDFGKDPEVTIGGEEAQVLGSRPGKILVRVPDGLDEGSAAIEVDGVEADVDFTVLEEGAPVVLRMSTDTATPGMYVFLIGRRLQDAEADFVDGDGNTVDTVELKGHARAAVLRVPSDIDEGEYTLVITNGDGLDTGDCSPAITIVAEGDPEIDDIEPEEALPGEKVTISGENLGPIGPVIVHWTDADDETLYSFGFTNGFDAVTTHVPIKAEPGATYEVAVEFHDGTTTDGVEYTVGELPKPKINKLVPDTGPAGSVFRIEGEGLLSFGGKPSVEMEGEDETLEPKILFAMPGMKWHDDVIVVAVPKDAADGTYDVTVTVGDQTSDPAEFEVAAPELTVTSMRPDTQKKWPTPVKIEGSGFGMPGSGAIKVTWEPEEGDAREGKVIMRMDRMLIVFPPGFPPGLSKGGQLAEGEYEVVVTVGSGDDAESVVAGTYTVK